MPIGRSVTAPAAPRPSGSHATSSRSADRAWTSPGQCGSAV